MSLTEYAFGFAMLLLMAGIVRFILWQNSRFKDEDE